MPNETLAKIYMSPINLMGGMITFEGVLGAGGPVVLTAAFSESPIPEPAAFVMIVMALSASAAGCRRRSH
jgi:hypothetical protein